MILYINTLICSVYSAVGFAVNAQSYSRHCFKQELPNNQQLCNITITKPLTPGKEARAVDKFVVLPLSGSEQEMAELLLLTNHA